MLRITLQSSTGHCYDTERLHSRNARKQLSRQMTHCVRASDLALHHSGRSFPSTIAGLFQKHTHREEKASAKVVKKTFQKKHKQRRVPQRAGKGGAWRAFIHSAAQARQRAGLPHRVDFKSCAESFATLAPAERARFVRIGKLATEAEGRAFPPTIAKAHVKLLRSSFPGSGGFSADGCPDQSYSLPG